MVESVAEGEARVLSVRGFGRTPLTDVSLARVQTVFLWLGSLLTHVGVAVQLDSCCPVSLDTGNVLTGTRAAISQSLLVSNIFVGPQASSFNLVGALESTEAGYVMRPIVPPYAALR